MKGPSLQTTNVIVISDSDSDDSRPGYAESKVDGPTTVIIISDSDDENEAVHARGCDVVAASATKERDVYEIVAPKIATAYVVFSGRTIGIFTDWNSTVRAIAGYNNMSVKSYGSFEEAQEAWKYAVTIGDVRPPSELSPSKRPANEVIKIPYQPKKISHRMGEGSEPTHRKWPSASHAAMTPGQAALLYASSSKQPQRSKRARISSTVDIDIVMGRTEGSLCWIVIRGRRPGVYLREEDAQKATMYCPFPIVDYAGTQEEANQIFVTKFMAGEIEVVKQEDLDFLSC